jgi:hypothetical protein
MNEIKHHYFNLKFKYLMQYENIMFYIIPKLFLNCSSQCLKIGLILFFPISLLVTIPNLHSVYAQCELEIPLIGCIYRDRDTEIIPGEPAVEGIVGWCVYSTSYDYIREGVAKGYYSSYLLDFTAPLYHFYNPGSGDHYYSLSGTAPAGYKEGPEGGGQICNVIPDARLLGGPGAHGIYPLYRYVSAIDHYYTTVYGDQNIRRGTMMHLSNIPWTTYPYGYEGTTGNLFRYNINGAVPLYRLVVPNGVHILSTHPDDYITDFNRCEWVLC